MVRCRQKARRNNPVQAVPSIGATLEAHHSEYGVLLCDITPRVSKCNNYVDSRNSTLTIEEQVQSSQPVTVEES
eukprot:364278-Pyramimonas_sp.AAC.1